MISIIILIVLLRIQIKMRSNNLKETERERMPFSEILSNPKKGLFTSLYTFFKGGYNPNLTEHNVTPSHEIPNVDISLLQQSYAKYSNVL